MTVLVWQLLPRSYWDSQRLLTASNLLFHPFRIHVTLGLGKEGLQQDCSGGWGH
jgi:hypothetical protein